MKAYDRMLAAVCVLLTAAAVFICAVMLFPGENTDARQYRVDAARIAAELETSAPEDIDLSKYETVVGITRINGDRELLGGREDYLLKSVGGSLYRIDYVSKGSARVHPAVIAALVLMLLLPTVTLLVIRTRVIKPFFVMREVPYELSKGNLTVPIKENKHHLFGRFTWGMNMLRDNLEEQKRRELSLQAEKKKLIISLSHDIKIPLSAIKLYAKALEKGMYGEDGGADAARKINAKADDIESYVSQIVSASSEDFLALGVENGEFYMSAVMDKIISHYSEKLALLGTGFETEKYGDCLICGDADRAVEVLQNIIENAIKYGDGKEISISFSDEEDCRLVTVKNSGCTLPPDELPHIFDSFFRGSNAGDKSGSGLGLYICRTLMRKMGGEIFASCRDDEMSVTAVFPRA